MNIKSTLVAIACLSVFSLAALPEIRITTKSNGGNLDNNNKKYVAVDKFQLSDPSNSRNDLTSNTTSGTIVDSIKVRGNSTAGLDKKPYRIKFSKKQSLFGKEEARSWVLLANFYDATFTLNAIAFEMGKRMGLEFTNSSQMVDLYINNQYKGIYQLTEQIQAHKGRVDLKEKHNGWLVEFDYHDPDADERSSYFTTGSNLYNLTTFIKHPELDDTIPNRPASYLNFVKNDINALVNKMKENSFPTNGYRDLIDMESFAKYVLIQLVMDNFDFNSKAQTGFLLGSNYAYKIDSCGSRIKAGPLWDFDLAAGLERTAPMGGGGGGWGWGGGGAATSTFPQHYKTYQDSIIPTHEFYVRLWSDPVFKAKYKKNWDKYKSDFQAMGTLIDNLKSQVAGSIEGKGDNKWNGYKSLMDYNAPSSVKLTTSTFNTEVQNLKTWWSNRINWVDQKLNSYNINTSADITQSVVDNSCKVVGGGNSSSSGSVNSSSSRASSSSVNNGSVSSSSRASSSSVVSSSSTNNSGQVTLSCTNLQPTMAPDGTIAVPTLTCSNGNTATNENWFGRPSSNTSWTRTTNSTSTSYTISLTATCGQVQGLQADCGTVKVGEAPTPIVPKQIALNIHAKIIGKAIMLENLPSNTKIELYNLQGKRIYSAHSGNSQTLKIQVQTGMYIMLATLGSEKKVQRFVVK